MERLIKQARDLKMLPDIAVKAVAAADDPTSTIQGLTDIVAQDPRMSIGILKLANSPLFPSYSASRNISCLKMAITRLGFRQAKQMILASCFSNMMEQMTFRDVAIREKLHQHSFLTGIVCTQLNSLFELGLQGEEFTAGLLHDIGRLLLAISLPTEFRQIDQLSFCEGEDFIKLEHSAIETDHAEVGAWFLSRNQMTDELVTVARLHHAPREASRFTRLVALVNIADQMANQYQSNRCLLDLEGEDIVGLKLLETLGVFDCIARFNEHRESVLEFAVDEFARVSAI